MSEDSLRTLAEFIGAIVIAWMTFYFTRSHYERQRRDELADKKTDKLTKFRDRNMEDVQTFIHTFIDLKTTVTVFEDVIATERVSDLSIAGFNKTQEKITESQKWAGSFVALNDPLLTTLSVTVVDTLVKEFVNALDLAEMIRDGKEFDKEAVLKRVEECSFTLNSLLGVMQRRLIELVKAGE